MEYRILGRTGLKVSRMGFGGIPIQRIDPKGTRELMLRLRDEGINYIDTGATPSAKAIWARLWRASGATLFWPPRA